MPETYVIFITDRDLLKRDQPLYRVERAVLGEHRLFEDLSHIIYVNGRVQDDTPLGFRKIFCYLMVSNKDSWYNDQTYVDTLNPRAIQEFVIVSGELL